MSCAVLNCRKRSNKTTDLRFFTFPKDEAVVQEWLKYCKPITNIKRVSREISTRPSHTVLVGKGPVLISRDKESRWQVKLAQLVLTARVCSIHFLPSDYNKTLRQILLNPQRSRALKPDAIPSLHLDLANHDQSHAQTISNDATPMVSETSSNWYSPSTQSAHWSTHEDLHQWETRLEITIKEEDSLQEQRQEYPTSATTNVQHHTVEAYQTPEIPTDLPQNNQPNQSNTLYKEKQTKIKLKDKRIQNLKKLVRKLKKSNARLKACVEDMKNRCKCQNVAKNDMIDDSLNPKTETVNGKVET